MGDLVGIDNPSAVRREVYLLIVDCGLIVVIGFHIVMEGQHIMVISSPLTLGYFKRF